MKKLSIAVIGIIFLLSGCTVLSFYPFYTKDVLVRSEKLTGDWTTYDDKEKPIIWKIYFPDSVFIENEDTQWEEKKVPNTYTYLLNCYRKNSDEDTVRFKIHLFKIKNQLFLDFMPEDWEIEHDMLAFHLMAAHTVAKVALDDSLDVTWMEPEWFDELIKENKIRIHHEKNEYYTLLTAKSKELVKFISKYASDEVAWKDGLEYNFCRKDD